MVLLKILKPKHPNFNLSFLTRAMNWLCVSATVERLTTNLSRKEVTMTSNQIAYFKAKIEEAHYGRSDQEQARSNRANEALKAYETSVNEAHYLRSDAENVRSNRAREAENYRSNRAKEDIEWSQIPSKNAERWSNVARNYADVTLKEASTQLTNADTNLRNQQAATEWYNTYNKKADTELKNAQRENVEASTYWSDMYAMSSVLSGFGNLFKGAASLATSAGTLYGGKENENKLFNQQTGKETQRWYSNGVEYQTDKYFYSGK